MAAVTPISGQVASPIGRAAPGKPVKGQAGKFSEVLARTEIGGPAKASSPTAGLPNAMLSRIDAGQKRLDEIIRQARSGRTFRPRELLAMQAEVYRISEELSLVNKVVQEGVSGIKRLWNLQV